MARRLSSGAKVFVSGVAFTGIASIFSLKAAINGENPLEAIENALDSQSSYSAPDLRLIKTKVAHGDLMGFNKDYSLSDIFLIAPADTNAPSLIACDTSLSHICKSFDNE